MNPLPALLVLHGVQRVLDAPTARWQRNRKVVHGNVLQSSLRTYAIVPVVTEVRRTQLDVR